MCGTRPGWVACACSEKVRRVKLGWGGLPGAYRCGSTTSGSASRDEPVTESSESVRLPVRLRVAGRERSSQLVEGHDESVSLVVHERSEELALVGMQSAKRLLGERVPWRRQDHVLPAPAGRPGLAAYEPAVTELGEGAGHAGRARPHETAKRGRRAAEVGRRRSEHADSRPLGEVQVEDR